MGKFTPIEVSAGHIEVTTPPLKIVKINYIDLVLASTDLGRGSILPR